jgi:hypothetical protein
MHTLNVFGELGMFVDPTKCKCPTCVDYCSKDTNIEIQQKYPTECWWCRTEFLCDKNQAPFCTQTCEHEHQVYITQEDESQKTQDYPSEDEEEPNCCINCGDEFYGKGNFCSSLCGIKRRKYVKSGAISYDSAEDDD